MKAKKKESADSGLFCFRLSKIEREELNELLDKAKAKLNKNKKRDEYVITKNEILFDLIKRGLAKITQEKD